MMRALVVVVARWGTADDVGQQAHDPSKQLRSTHTENIMARTCTFTENMLVCSIVQDPHKGSILELIHTYCTYYTTGVSVQYTAQVHKCTYSTTS